MEVSYKFHLNGQARTVKSDPRRSLLDVLREDLGLTGTKYGCGEGQCRACTVLIEGKPAPSCLTSIAAIENKDVQTIEGLATEERLHPVQQAFLDEGAMQCGYCVPGMVLTAVGLLQQNPNPSQEEIAEGMSSNICRCCGYTNILKAVRRAVELTREKSA